MSNTRTAKQTEVQLAKIQLDAGEQDVRLPEDERAEVTGDGEIKLKLRDKEFLIADEFSSLALMEWAACDATTSLMATYRLLKSVVAEEDFAAFTNYANEVKVSSEELVDFLNAAVEAIAGRPTKTPGH